MTGLQASSFTLERVSAQSPEPASWRLGIFAHNEAPRILDALDSVGAAACGTPVDVVVLANGCTDATADRVRSCGNRITNLWLATILRGDKANAWNLFVHEILPSDAPAPAVWFFCDGDVTLAPSSLSRLAAALESTPGAVAAGGMPATGRSRDVWRQRMVRYGVLAGNLYALRGTFVESLEADGIRIPVGLFGEDRFVSWLALGAGNDEPAPSAPRIVFQPDAEFRFRSLSAWRLSDWRVFFRRQRRYATRALQHEMLRDLYAHGSTDRLPAHVDDLYRAGPLPSRLVWTGWCTPWRLAAVLRIRRRRFR